MTEPPSIPEDVDLARGEAALEAATAQLRDAAPTARTVEVADRILDRALSAPRRAVLVRTDDDLLQVSSTAITALLHHALDDALRGAAVRRVGLDVDRDGRLAAATIDLVVQYGTVVADVAEQARTHVHRTLAAVLGPDLTSGGRSVTVGNVHVGDVTRGDPRVVDPLDEHDAPL